ncbi:hypothetical protein H4R20_003688, partial [Coemansia guatemalensis]
SLSPVPRTSPPVQMPSTAQNKQHRMAQWLDHAHEPSRASPTHSLRRRQKLLQRRAAEDTINEEDEESMHGAFADADSLSEASTTVPEPPAARSPLRPMAVSPRASRHSPGAGDLLAARQTLDAVRERAKAAEEDSFARHVYSAQMAKQLAHTLAELQRVHLQHFHGRSRKSCPVCETLEQQQRDPYLFGRHAVAYKSMSTRELQGLLNAYVVAMESELAPHAAATAAKRSESPAEPLAAMPQPRDPPRHSFTPSRSRKPRADTSDPAPADSRCDSAHRVLGLLHEELDALSRRYHRLVDEYHRLSPANAEDQRRRRQMARELKDLVDLLDVKGEQIAVLAGLHPGAAHPQPQPEQPASPSPKSARGSIQRAFQVRRQIIRLSPLSPSSITLLEKLLGKDRHHGFKQKDGPFMPSGLLRAAFLRTLQDFPILAGRIIIDGDGRGSIVVDKSNLNMPEYVETRGCVHYRFLEAANFNWEAVPHKVPTVGVIPSRGADGCIKMVNVHALRLRSNSGLVLFVNMPHCVVDGVGYSAFVNRWAEVCRWLQDGAASDLPHRTYTFDRAVVDRAMPENMSPLNVPMRRAYTYKSYLGRFLAWLSPETRGDLLTEGCKLSSTVGHVFYIKRETLEQLRSQLMAKRSQGQPQQRRLSDNDMLTALIGHVVSKSICDAEDSAQRGVLNTTARAAIRAMFGSCADEIMMLMTADIRPRLRGLAQMRYVGGGITGVPIFHPLRALAEESSLQLGAACARVRQTVDAWHSGVISRIDHTLNSDPACFGHALAQVLLHPHKLIITNQSRFPLYASDFGAGAPQWISPLPAFLPSFASILPQHPGAAGYHVYISVERHLMSTILRSPLWTSLTSLVY